MPEQNSTFLAEMVAAARGVFALLTGDRAAARYFDLSARGLAGSFIALIGLIGMELVVQMALGQPGDTLRGAVRTALLFAGIIAGAATMLRLIGRPDAFRPYLIAFNWMQAIFTVALLVVSIGPALLLLAVLIAGFVTSINAARLILTLKPLQIAMLLASQAIGAGVALMLILVVVPPTVAEMAVLNSPPL